MKSAYELAMERLNKVSPTVKLTAEQKSEIADLESRGAAKIAEREISLRDAAAAAREKGDFDQAAELEQELVNFRQKVLAETEEKKERVRQGGKR